MFKQNKSLFVIAIIAVVNALGYGIIIPILYTYSKKFGLTDFQNGLLFSIFSVCQFLSTPLIGRLSDKYGRKPLLVISLMGTVVSFVMMAFAQNALFLFLARALDGLTAGNIPVATAVISDTTDVKNRAKGFGIIGASFGFGFIFGPAISALTIGFNESIPFMIAALISLIAVLMTIVILPETNKHKGRVAHGKLFDIIKLWHALLDQNVGKTLLVTLSYSGAFGLYMYAFQPFAIHVIHMDATQISALFTLFGVIGVISQTVIIPKVTHVFGDKKTLMYALFITTCTFFGFYITSTLMMMLAISIIQALANGFINPLIQSLLSKEADSASQGEILGINASYMSIGLIIGPIAGGALGTISEHLPFLLGSICCAFCFILARQILRGHVHKVAL